MRRFREAADFARLVMGGPGVDNVSVGVVRGAVISFSTSAAGMLISAVSNLVMARLAGVEEFGVYSYLLSWTAALAFLSSLGFESTVIRFAPTYEQNREWGLLRGLSRWTHGVAVAAGVGVGSVFVLVTLVSSDASGFIRASIIAALLIPLMAALTTSQGILRAMRRVFAALMPVSVVRPSVALALTLAIFAVDRRYLDATGLMTVTVLGTTTAMAIGLLSVRRALPAETFGAVPVVKAVEWIRVSLPLLLLGFVRILLLNADVVLVGLLVGTAEAGIYAIGSRLTQVVTLGNISANVIAVPLLSRAWGRNDRAETQKIVTVSSWIGTLGALAIGGLLVLIDQSVLGWAGAEFVQGVAVVQILILGHVINAFTGPVSQILNMTGHERTNAKIAVVALVFYMVASVPVISTWGILGAAWLRVTLLGLKNVWTWFVVRRLEGVNSSILARWLGPGGKGQER